MTGPNVASRMTATNTDIGYREQERGLSWRKHCHLWSKVTVILNSITDTLHRHIPPASTSSLAPSSLWTVFVLELQRGPPWLQTTRSCTGGTKIQSVKGETSQGGGGSDKMT
jgi:hypothetical protein